MRTSIARAACALALIVVVVIVDILFFRHNTADRWLANVGIVAVFAASGFLIFRGSEGKKDDPPPSASGT